MKVQELRQLVGASDRGHLEKAFVETYKLLRKGQKEEFDQVMADILAGKATEKKTASPVSFDELEQQMMVFFENAYLDNYIAPNRTVPKAQRPKWRFMVKNFIKELEKIPLESESYSRAVKLLTDLYCLICEACNYYIFSTEDAFRSIGWEQQDLFELVVKKTFAAGYSRENISQLVLYATTNGLSRESLPVQQEFVLINGLRTSDVKMIAIEEVKKLIEERTSKLVRMGKYDDRRYHLEIEINELCTMFLALSITLAESEKGVEYYFKHAQNYNQEVTLYCALELIELMEEDDLWIKTYEYGVKKKIKPRDNLKTRYEELKGVTRDGEGV